MIKAPLIWLFAPVRPVRWPTRRRRRSLVFWGPGQAEVTPALRRVVIPAQAGIQKR